MLQGHELPHFYLVGPTNESAARLKRLLRAQEFSVVRLADTMELRDTVCAHPPDGPTTALVEAYEARANHALLHSLQLEISSLRIVAVGILPCAGPNTIECMTMMQVLFEFWTPKRRDSQWVAPFL